MTSLELRDISAAYGRNRILDGVSLEIASGEFVSLLGPSGCGKTTLLRIIAGLKDPARGDLLFDGRSIVDLPAEKRRIAMVFQKPLLFPYLNVAENVAFGLKMKGLDRETTARKVNEALALVRMEGFGDRSSRQLSGGQEQRVALARAIVTEPRILLLDEPFSALDEELRIEMRELVRSLQRRIGITTVFVTHDQDEAAALSDRIALLLDGTLIQTGPPRDFYLSPATESAARFFKWKVRRGEVVDEEGSLRLKTPVGTVDLPDAAARSVAFRPERAVISTGERDDSAGSFTFSAVVERVTDLGTVLRCRLVAADGETLEVDLPAGAAPGGLAAGTPVRVSIAARDLRFFA
ncbi:MAG: ABC transporter ATP-binding protein [Blastocatellales bacterium]